MKPLILASLVAMVFAIFSYAHITYTARRAAVDFKSQNFEEIDKGDSLSLATKLNSLSTDDRWRCVSIYKNGQQVFRTDGSGCGWGLFDKKIEVKGTNTSGLIVGMIFVMPTYFKVFIILIFLGMFITIILMFKWMRLAYEKESLLYQEIFDIARRTAHDLRSPLSVVQIVSSVLSRNNDERGFILKKAADRLSDIATELLNRSKTFQAALNGESAAHPEINFVDAEQIIQSMLDEKIQAGIKRKFVFEKNKIEKELKLLAEKVELTRIISNIISNSVEATAEETGLISCKVYLKNHSLCIIEISDNGTGVDSSVLSKLGDKIIQSQKKDGTGIGLYFAKKKLSSWGGNLKVESKVGSGTTIYLELRVYVEKQK